MQAYNCLTDVLVREFVSSCMRYTSPTVLNSPAYKYLASMEDKTCHIEVIEYCDLGNLSNALKNNIFLVPERAGDPGSMDASSGRPHHRVRERG